MPMGQTAGDREAVLQVGNRSTLDQHAQALHHVLWPFGQVGQRLLDNSLAICRQNKVDLKEIDVNSSPWAVPVYHKLGFVSDGPEQEVNGIRFTRMVKQL